ncbi:hypothetical protein ACFS07_17440 [Undibacterium arcticum]
MLAAGKCGAEVIALLFKGREKAGKTRFRFHGPDRFANPPIRRFSSTVRLRNSRLPSGTIAIPLATISLAGFPPIGSPAKMMALGGRLFSCPHTVFQKKVDFPAPLEPMIETVSLSPISKIDAKERLEVPVERF